MLPLYQKGMVLFGLKGSIILTLILIPAFLKIILKTIKEKGNNMKKIGKKNQKRVIRSFEDFINLYFPIRASKKALNEPLSSIELIDEKLRMNLFHDLSLTSQRKQ